MNRIFLQEASGKIGCYDYSFWNDRAANSLADFPAAIG
jgi:hypothetical protein